MFCPTCGIENQDKVKFCRRCGANVSVVQEALQHGLVKWPEPRPPVDPKAVAVHILLQKIEETKPLARDWWTGRLVLPQLLKELERLTTTPEEQRQKYIRRGVVITVVGGGLTLFLYLFLGALASYPFMPDEVAPLLRLIWIKGLIPVFIGLAITLYGLLLGRPSPRLARKSGLIETESGQAADESFITQPAPFSVTEQTTTRMESPGGEALRLSNDNP